MPSNTSQDSPVPSNLQSLREADLKDRLLMLVGARLKSGEWEVSGEAFVDEVLELLTQHAISARLDEIQLFAKECGPRTEKEAWHHWAFRVTDYFKNRIAELKGKL